MSRSVSVYHPRELVRSLPGEAILPQSEWRTRCVLWTLYHKAGRKGSAARGKRKKICLFRQMGLYIPCGGISALSGLPWASHLPQGGRQVSPSCRGVTGLFHVKRGPDWPKLWAGKSACPLRLAYGKPPPPEGEASFPPCRGVAGLFHVKRGLACLKLWAGKRALALSGLPWASHLPQKGRRVFASCRGFAGLFHVKHARLALSRERERAPALSGLPMASHLPQRGRRVSAPCRGFTDLIHVKRKRQRSFRLAASPVGNE